MKTFAAILLLGVAAASRRRSTIVGAEQVKATCNSVSKDGLTRMRTSASSWEADGSGDVISPDRVADKVAAAEVQIGGKARLPIDSTHYAFVESDCTAEAPDSFDSTLADFDVNANSYGYARYNFKTSDFLASDLIDGAMTLNLRDAAGASVLCCTFEAPVERERNGSDGEDSSDDDEVVVPVESVLHVGGLAGLYGSDNPKSGKSGKKDKKGKDSDSDDEDNVAAGLGGAEKPKSGEKSDKEGKRGGKKSKKGRGLEELLAD